MSQQASDKWNDMVKKIQEPFKAIAELNSKALQEVSYLKPEEITQLKKPEELLEKQINLAVENGHKALNYLQQSFQIMEKAMLEMVSEKSENKSKDDLHPMK